MNGAGGLRVSGLRVLDRRFAHWVRESFVDQALDAGEGDLVERLAAAVSHALHLKHGCLDLARLSALGEPVLNDLLAGIEPADVATLAEDHPAIAVSATTRAARRAGAPTATPLLRSEDGRRIWLQKYAVFERTVADRVRALAGRPEIPVSDGQSSALERLYPPDDPRFADQRRATELALSRGIAVITGGPGTGKTWTVAAIIGLLRRSEPELRIALAAPTGKAANRVMESLRQAAGNSLFEGLFADRKLPDQARTLHALLEVGYHSVKPRRKRDHPLDCDVLIVDEASMVDLPMMARVLDALPEHGRLILLGDKDQLASVEAGGVLADLCRAGADTIYGPLTSKTSAPVAALTHNHRSTAAIQALAETVNDGAWRPPEADSEVRVHTLGPGTHAQDAPGWLTAALAHHRSLTEAIEQEAGIAELLARLGEFQLLCALREGPAGVAGINRRLERILGVDYRRRTGREPERADRPWFPGLPVMVLRNDHERRLYNGDVGMVLPVAATAESSWVLQAGGDDEADRLRACFPVAGGGSGVKAISLAQMPPFESAFALTVHKAQGSEYGRVSLVLPDDLAHAEDHPVLTRELLYTGITRAKEQLDLWAGAGVPEAVARRRTVRMSGLDGEVEPE